MLVWLCWVRVQVRDDGHQFTTGVNMTKIHCIYLDHKVAVNVSSDPAVRMVTRLEL